MEHNLLTVNSWEKRGTVPVPTLLSLIDQAYSFLNQILLKFSSIKYDLQDSVRLRVTVERKQFKEDWL